MHIPILSSRGTLFNFSLPIAGNIRARGRFVLPIHTVGPAYTVCIGSCEED